MVPNETIPIKYLGSLFNFLSPGPAATKGPPESPEHESSPAKVYKNQIFAFKVLIHYQGDNKGSPESHSSL